jgi:hypothetical protein
MPFQLGGTAKSFISKQAEFPNRALTADRDPISIADRNF